MIENGIILLRSTILPFNYLFEGATLSKEELNYTIKDKTFLAIFENI